MIENGYDEDYFTFQSTHVDSLGDSFLISSAGRLLTELALPKSGFGNGLGQLFICSTEPIDYCGRNLIHLIKTLQIIKEDYPELLTRFISSVWAMPVILTLFFKRCWFK